MEGETLPEPVAVTAALVETEPSMEASQSTSTAPTVQSKEALSVIAAVLPFTTPHRPYKTLEYFIQGDPKQGKRDGVFWYVIVRGKHKTQSDQSYSSPIAANFAAIAAIDTLMGNAAPEPCNLRRS
ncbi:MAG TPA: hypothetical protein V6D18_02845 [Thermosynechococcaceae cyanobacterium]